MNPEIQQYIRVILYMTAGSLMGKLGIVVSESTTTAIVGLVMAAGTLAWTIYGSRLNALLERVKAKDGVEKVEVTVPDIQKAVDITVGTSPGIIAKAKPE